MQTDPHLYPMEFRRQLLELVRFGWTPEQLSREFALPAHAMMQWAWQFERDQESSDSAENAESHDLAYLRREVIQLRRERDILKAVTRFAREGAAVSSRRLAS